MRFRITKKISDYILQTIGSARGASAQLARDTGIAHPAISKILKGKYPAVQEDTWLRLCSRIKGLSELASPLGTATGRQQSPIAIARTGSGNNSPATAIAGGSFPLDTYRLHCQDRLLALGLDSETTRKVVEILREEAERLQGHS